jgi:hypothetical protein
MSQENVQVENAVVAAPQVLRITISDVLGLLDQGKSRKEIAEHYGRTQLEMKKMVWDHPKLKNRKAKKQYIGIELEDDTEDINDAMRPPLPPGEEETTTTEPVVEPVAVMEEAQVEGPSSSDWN